MEYRSFKGSGASWLLTIVGVVVIGLIVWLSVSPAEQASVSAPPIERETPGLDDAIDIGSFYAYIHSIDESEPDGDNNKIVTIDVSARNATKTADSFFADQILLRDAQGREYKAEIGAFGKIAINPGVTEKGTVKYKVPAEAEITTAMVRAEMVDMGGADYVRVDLTK